MIGQSKMIGSVVLGVAVLAGLVVVGWLVALLAEGNVGVSGFVLGLMLAGVPLAILAGSGVYLCVLGGRERAEYAQAEQEKRLLNMLETRGQLRISEAVIELGSTRERVRQMVYDLVGKGLFSGYINWNEGVLYAQQASAMRRKCPNCGGAIELAGRGTFACPYCGSELLLASEDESGVQSASEPAVSEVQS